MSVPIIRCCADCAKKLSDKYVVNDLPGWAMGRCQFCHVEREICRFELSPRLQRYPRRTGGGGERKRAGGR